MVKSIKKGKINKNKIKRIFLVLTVFIICLFMVGFGVSKLSKNNTNIKLIKNADKQAGIPGTGSLSGWEMYFDMYTNNDGESIIDRTHSYNNLEYEFPSDSGTKLLTLQVSYSYTGNTSYPANSLQIKVPIFKTGTASDAELYTVQKVVNSGQWSYTEQTIEGKPYIIFTNNNDIALSEAGEHLEGSFQIAYLITGKDVYVRYNDSTNSEVPLTKTIDAQFINTQDNNTLDFGTKTVQFNIGKSDYNLTKTASKLTSLDGIPAGDYTWIKYTVTARRNDGLRSTVQESAANLIREDLPSANCKILDKNLNEVSISNDNHYWINGYTTYDEESQETITWTLYIGYPVDEFDGEEITNTAYFYGKYTDSQSGFNLTNQTHEVEYIKDASVTLNERDFKFEYQGYLYGIQKNQSATWRIWTSRYLSTEKIVNNYDSVTYYISPYALYSGTEMTVRVGDDRQYLVDTNGTDGNGEITGSLTGEIQQWMDEADYFFTSVTIPVFKNGNGQNIGTYQAKLFVRYYGSDTFVEYGTFDTSASKTYNFTQTEHVVSWYFEIYDMTESITNQLSSYMANNQQVLTTIAYSKSDLYDLYDNTYSDTDSYNYSGKIHNFCYINVFDHEGTLLNEVQKSSYSGTGFNDGLADWDFITYGHYMQRSTNSADFVQGKEGYRIEKSFVSSSANYDNTKWTGKFTLKALPLSYMGFNVGEITKIDIYDLLPEGMEYDSSKTIDISTSWSYCFSGDYTNWTQFLKEHTTTEIIYDYNNTNRTKIHISTDLTGYNVSSTCNNSEVISASIPVYVSYDALAEYGLEYTNHGFVNIQPGGGKLIYPYSRITTLDINNGKSLFTYDTGNNGVKDPDVADINENGLTSEEALGYSKDTIRLLSAYSSESALKKYVRSYTINDDDSITYNSEWKESITMKSDDHYEYKLRVRNSMDNSLTNVVLYDNLESYYYNRQSNQYESAGDGWQGVFEGVDTSALESEGYKVKVYYSTNSQAGSLYNSGRTSISSDWNLLSNLNESNYSQVKSIAIEVLDQNNDPAIIPIDKTIYAVVQMKPPASITKEYAYNAYWIEWNALDNTGQVIGGLDGIHSNVTTVAVEGLNMMFLKTDANGTALPGATLQILDSNNVVVDEWTSTGEAHVVSGLLVANETYKLHEVSAPSGYKPAEDVTFTATNMTSTDNPITLENTKTKITIKKVDEDGNNLAGASLQILDSDNTVVEEWMSTTEAHVITGKLNFGEQYTLHEVSAPAGYIKAQDQTFSLSKTDTNQTITMTDKKTKVSIIKQDESGNGLAGATLQVLSGTTVIDEWTSTTEAHEINGVLEANKQYTLHEVEAPEGYVAAADQTFTVNTTGTIQTITVVNVKTKVSIIKQDENGNGLAGATLQVLSGSTVIDEWTSTTSAHEINGVLEPNKQYTLHEVKAPDGYVPAANQTFTVNSNGDVKTITMTDKKTKISIIKQDEDGNGLAGATLQLLLGSTVIDEWTSTTSAHEINGVLKVGETYTLKETGVPSGYVQADDVSVTVASTENVQTFRMTDKKTSTSIIKVDEDGNPLSGAVLQILDQNNSVVTQWTSTQDAHEINGLLASGKTYKLHEVSAPDGYVVASDVAFTKNSNGTKQTITMTDKKTKISIKKVDESGNNVTGATLQVLDSQETVIDEWTTDGSLHEINGVLTVGQTYKLHEKTAPEGYVTASDKTFTVNNTDSVQTITMTDKKTGVNIRKVDEDGNNIAGASLVIKDSTGNIVKRWTSTQSSYTITGELIAGKTYTVEELTPPDGYAYAVSKQFIVPSDGSSITVTFTDTKTNLQVRKVDSNGNNISGVTLQILDATNSSVVRTITTTSQPATVTGLIAGHRYILHEASAPDGYTIASDINFTMNTDIGTQQIVMTDRPTSVTINKVDSQGNRLEGATLQILSGTTVIDEWTTTSSSSHEIIGVLGAGKQYTLHEVTPPKGYITAPDKTFTVNTDTTNLNVEMVDEANNVSVIKISAETNEPLPGALLQILDSNDNVVYEFTSTEEKHVITGQLVTGATYKLHEAGAPERHARAQDVTFTVENSTEELELEMVDPLTKIYISKVDNKNKNLSGAVLQILDKDQNVIKEFTSTDKDIEIEGLLNELEVYTLHEVKAPEGYNKIEDIKFKIDETGHLNTFNGEQYVQVENNILVAVDKEVIVNPQTTFVAILLTAIIGSVVGIMTFVKRKQKLLKA